MSIPGQSGAGEFEIYTWRRIPVALSPWFFLLVVIVFWRDHNPITATITVLVFAGSVLLHEYGHAFMAQRYGLTPRIVLHAFGGWCEHRQAYDRRKSFFVSAAGPAATLLLAAGGWVLSELVQDRAGTLVYFALRSVAYINAFLAVLNLLPILPLDGGTMFHHALAWYAPQDRADGMAYWTGAVLSVILCGLGFIEGSLFIAILFGMFAYQNATLAQPFDIKHSFVAQRKRAPSNRMGIGYPISPQIWTFAALTLVSWISASAIGTASEVGALSLRPFEIAESPWAVLSHAFVYRPWDWGPLLFTLFSLGAFAPVVQKRTGAIGFVALYLGAIALGLAAAMLPVGLLLAQPDTQIPSLLLPRPVYGATAANAALLVAWAGIAPNKPVFFTPFAPRMIAPTVLVFGVLCGLFVTHWAWMPAVGGALAGLLAWAVTRRSSGASDGPLGKQVR